MLVMTLRDHAHAKAPYLLAAEGDREGLLEGDETLAATAQAALVGSTGYDITNPLSAYNPHGPDAVIDQDVLWSCTSCGACVEQCPVDIEHVDAIVDMRRYQVLIESAFPSELGGLFKNLENKQNPWGMSARARLDWAKDLPFEVKIAGQDVEDLAEVDYLFWVGCAGAYEDRAKKTTRAVAELLDTAGVSFAVLGDGETCTGDPARRAGNEFLFQMLAQANVEVLNEVGAKKIVVTCAHCFNTLKNEYPQVGGQYEVVHHTQLLNRLVREKKLVPVSRPAEADTAGVASTAESVTYHDPCYLGRHNGEFDAPRAILERLGAAPPLEFALAREKAMCCGAGGGRMWIDETIGTRINVLRVEQALETSPQTIATACPYCAVMMEDGLAAVPAAGTTRSRDIAELVAAALVAEAPVGQESPAVPAGVGAGAGSPT
jgi:Fe-S oxidoreductase